MSTGPEGGHSLMPYKSRNWSRGGFIAGMAGATVLSPFLQMDAYAEQHRPKFNLEAEWLEALGSPTWYLKIIPDYVRLVEDDTRQAQAAEFFIEERLMADKIILGKKKEGKNWDSERKPIDAVVIHHTGSNARLRLSYISALELLRIYGPEYVRDPEIRGQPVYSGHFRGNEQVFWPYHKLIRVDGTVENMLEEGETGWQAGSWDMNCRSLAPCLEGNHLNTRPPDVQLFQLASVIREYEKKYPGIKILGHNEVRPERHITCPSNLFSVPGGWKEDLLALI